MGKKGDTLFQMSHKEGRSEDPSRPFVGSYISMQNSSQKNMQYSVSVSTNNSKDLVGEQMSDENKEILSSIKTNSFGDKAFGCVLGAFTADACGSFLEFNRKVATDEQMDACMRMEGGGPFKLSAGQITDDSELALCLLKGLNESTRSKSKKNEDVVSIQLDSVVTYYRNWLISPPFDIGKNTKGALKPLLTKCEASQSIKAANEKNKESMSNGSLMRCTPMAVFTASVNNEKDIRSAILGDVSLTHPNKFVHEAIVQYCLAIHYVLNNPQDADRGQKAFDMVWKATVKSPKYNDKVDKSK